MKQKHYNVHIGRIYDTESTPIQTMTLVQVSRYINDLSDTEYLYNVMLLTATFERPQDQEIYITERKEALQDGLCSLDVDGNGIIDIHLHEYESYEDAYKVATDMREGNPKCYN